MNYAKDRLDRRARYNTTTNTRSTNNNKNGNQSKNNKSSSIVTEEPCCITRTRTRINSIGSSASPLEADLNQAHELLRRHQQGHVLHGNVDGRGVTANNNNNIDDMDNVDNVDDKVIQHQIIQGHELAARSLRDQGKNSQSLFHYGQAWLLSSSSSSFSSNTNEKKNIRNDDDHNQEQQQVQQQQQTYETCMEQKIIGDYVQMTEFNGIPEIGILALLFYFNGGTLNLEEEEQEEECNNNNNNHNNNHNDEEKYNINHCGCGMKQCHTHSNKYYIPKSMLSSRLLKDILQSIQRLEQCIHHSHFQHHHQRQQGHQQSNDIPNASMILDQISKYHSKKTHNNTNKKKNKNEKNRKNIELLQSQALHQPYKHEYSAQYNSRSSSNNNKFDIHQLKQQGQGQGQSHVPSLQSLSFLPTNPLIPIDSILQFWHVTITATANNNNSSDDDNDNDDGDDDNSKYQKQLSPLLQILLLKLLYTNSNVVIPNNVRTSSSTPSTPSSPFLYLSMEAIKCLSLSSMPLDTPTTLSKYMAKHYKSHWAYYVLIYKIAFGQRMKKQRQRQQYNDDNYHVPIWDIVHGLRQRQRRCSRNMDILQQNGEKATATAATTNDTTGVVDCLGNKDDEIDSGICHTSNSTRSISSGMKRNVTCTVSSYLDQILKDASSIHKFSHPASCFEKYIHHDDDENNDVKPLFNNHGIIYALGDSHVLSFGWQTIQIKYEYNKSNNKSNNNSSAISSSKNNKSTRNNNNAMILHRTIIPYPVTGLKAWHTRKNTEFFTHANLISNIQRLIKISSSSSCQTILLSTGEIDCREGIGGVVLQGYSQSCNDAVENTVQEYVKAVEILAQEYNLQVLLLPVAPHAYRSEKNGKAKGRAMRRERMVVWNDTLRSLLCRDNRDSKSNKEGEKADGDSDNTDCFRRVFLLDYEEKLRFPDKASPVGFVLNNTYNADYTHMNSAFLPHLEEAIERCGCNLDLV